MKKIFINKFTAKIFLPWLLKLDNTLYKLISRMSVLHNDGIHPKHHILRYENWFIDRVEKNHTVLEVGSHKGEMSRKLSEHVNKVIAIEIVEDNYKKAVEQNTRGNIEYICADATKYIIEEEVDVLIMSNVLEHIKERDSFLTGVLANLKWKSTPKVLIRVPMRTRDWVTCFKKEMGVYYFLDPTHYIEYTEEELQEELERSGLRIESMQVRFGEAYVSCTK